MIIYEFFGFLWVAALIIACSQFVITVTVCIWYFSSTLTIEERLPSGLELNGFSDTTLEA